MEFRPIKKKDIDAILAMIIQYRKEQNKLLNDSQKTEIKKQLSILVHKKSSTTLVCTEENEVAGFINMHICPFPLLGGRELYISDLLIKQEQRDKGIGKKFLTKAEDIARIHGCTRIMLNNGKDAESYKRSFYVKSGFIERENFANFIKIM